MSLLQKIRDVLKHKSIGMIYERSSTNQPDSDDSLPPPFQRFELFVAPKKGIYEIDKSSPDVLLKWQNKICSQLEKTTLDLPCAHPRYERDFKTKNPALSIGCILCYEKIGSRIQAIIDTILPEYVVEVPEFDNKGIISGISHIQKNRGILADMQKSTLVRNVNIRFFPSIEYLKLVAEAHDRTRRTDLPDEIVYEQKELRKKRIGYIRDQAIDVEQYNRYFSKKRRGEK